MINPLCVSTDGYLKSTKQPLSISVNGYLYFGFIPIPVKKKSGGGSNIYNAPRRNELIDVIKEQPISYDDSEILIILKAFVQCQEYVLKN